MCSILGVSFAPGSTIDRRKLAAALLTAGESRGRDASGYAWVDADGTDGLYKKDVPGSRLHVGKLPQSATAMILHTRASTHGDPRDNDNNHPVLSPSGNIRLVHNGVIYNHDDIREAMGAVGKKLPDVDTAVLPAAIELWGLDSTDKLEGYASAAWFDRETDDTIHLARFKTSSVYFAMLWDGSFAFASEDRILAHALQKVGVAWYGSFPQPFDSMSEGDYFQIMGGEILTESEVEWKKSVSYSGRDWSATTSGGKSGFGTVVRKGSEDEPMALGTVASLVGDMDDEEYDAAQELRRNISPLFSSEGESLLTDEEYDNWVHHGTIFPLTVDQLAANGADPDMPDVSDYYANSLHPADLQNIRPMFYTQSHDGDYASYTTQSGLLSALSWYAGLSGGENHLVGPEEGNLRWVNHFMDIGALNDDGSEQWSWVTSEGDFLIFENLFPGWVREGVAKLRQLVGA